MLDAGGVVASGWGWAPVVELVGAGAGCAIAGGLIKLARDVSRLQQEVADHLKFDHPRREVWSPLTRRQRTGHR